MMMEGSWMGDAGQYGYNGIEYENFLDLEMNLATYRGLDPTLGRWWQVDPYAEAAFSHSPYNSMFNNPVSMSDPEGDLPFLAVVAIGAASTVFSNGLSNISQGNNFFDGAGKAAFWGGIGAAASLGVGTVFGATGTFVKELGRAGAHALTQGGISAAQGGSFSQGALSGGISSGIGSGIHALGGNAGHQILGGGLSGGIGSVIGGGNFWQGMGQGIAVGGFNHTLHGVAENAFAEDDCCTGLDRQMDRINRDYIQGNISEEEFFAAHRIIGVGGVIGFASNFLRGVGGIFRFLGAAKGVPVPKGWIKETSKKGGGKVLKDPNNPHNQIRQMPGNPNSPNPAQRNPYVKFMKDGRFYDVKGNPLPSGNVPGAHIPLNKFNINNMPKF